MRRIAIVGAGQAGALLALSLVRRNYEVTLMTNRTADEVRNGAVMSSQCMFDSGLTIERELGADDWAQSSPQIHSVGVDCGDGTRFSAELEYYAQSVDQRLKCAVWIEQFVAAGGKLVIRSASVGDLEELAHGHDLVIVSTGKGDLGRLFTPDEAKSPFDRPQRALGVTYLRGLAPASDGTDMSINLLPGVGECFVLPALTTSGPCHIVVFEGVPGGPMDCWDDVHTPEQHLQRSLELLQQHFPRQYDRCASAELTDDGGVLRGRLTPVVRQPVAELPSGALVLGMADAIVLNDPVTGQGANNAAQAAGIYLSSITGRGSDQFDRAWMRKTFDTFWRGWAQWGVAWTNTMLRPPAKHVLGLFAEAERTPGVAAAIVDSFNDPRTTHNWWYDAEEAERFTAAKRRADGARFDARDLRRALGQYATGVTVITSRAPDGRKIGLTANSFTSVSMDPPLVLWCPGKQAPSLADLTAASHFAVNVLGADQHDLSRQFATPAEDKFAGVGYTEGCGGAPLLDDAVARFQCRTVRRVDAGDHIIFLGEVERYDAPGGDPLVFHSGGYRVAARHPDYP